MMTIEQALKIKQKWSSEQARNDLERLLLRDERPADKVVALACKALEKQIPKKPIKAKEHIMYSMCYICPNCQKNFSGTGIASYCYHCGQALDWSDEKSQTLIDGKMLCKRNDGERKMTGTNIYIEQAKHAIGLDYKNPYHRHGRAFYKPYRNYFCTTKDDEIWAVLQNVGYAKCSEEHNGCVDFYLTRDGLDWLGEELDIKIYNEER